MIQLLENEEHREIKDCLFVMLLEPARSLDRNTDRDHFPFFEIVAALLAVLQATSNNDLSFSV